MPPAHSVDEYFLDPRAIRRAFDRAAATFDANAVVHTEIRTRLLERLDVVRLDPALIVDLGAGTGHGSRALQERYPRSQVLAIDLSTRMLIEARRQQRWLRRFQRAAADGARLPLRDGGVDMVFSNLMLQWCNDPDAIFRETRRVLRAGGLLTFASLGPDSLRELRHAWARVDSHVHVHRFIDMHDLGDALMRAGFAEPVMDTERLTITYPTLDALQQELRASGSRNRAAGRGRGLSGKAAGELFAQAIESNRVDGAVPITLEVVYGHAWAGAGIKERDRGEFRIGIGAIGRRS